MNKLIPQVAKLFLAMALLMLLCALVLGVVAAQSYIFPTLWQGTHGFSVLRPLHVSSALFWILLGATGCVYSALWSRYGHLLSGRLALAQLLLWTVAVIWIAYLYFTGNFGGREYWEFNPWPALLIAAAWVIFLINFIKAVRSIQKWHVYVWMWMTGILFFLFTFIENYLWIFPYFREHFTADMTIQWKANGSLVGAWNQLLYGTSFYLMERISGEKNSTNTPSAFAMYFLGLFNLMFNWGHHVYTLPSVNYVRYVGYAVSMTEWIFFARILYTWKQSVSTIRKHYHYFPYRFLMAAEAWVFINMTQAVLMSIPVLNLYTHGTHVTVAHAMGTTIGINSMILMAACFEFTGSNCFSLLHKSKTLNVLFWITQISLFIFWFSLNAAGIQKGIWQMSEHPASFSSMVLSLRPWFIVFGISGLFLSVSLGTTAYLLLRNYMWCLWRNPALTKHKSVSVKIKFT